MTNDIAEFLTSRRAKITPEQAGLSIYVAEPDSASAHALGLLASWTATPHQADTADVGDQPIRR
jgi:hypothetical protein